VLFLARTGGEERPARTREDHAMNATAAPVAADNPTFQADDVGPRFLDDAFDARADDLGDWWLDLGRVDLPVGGR
jgi:hypothetical protein